MMAVGSTDLGPNSRLIGSLGRNSRPLAQPKLMQPRWFWQGKWSCIISARAANTLTNAKESRKCEGSALLRIGQSIRGSSETRKRTVSRNK